MKKISFVIPCYKSSKTIASVVAEIDHSMLSRKDYSCEIILVNDSSPDDTLTTLKNLRSSAGRIVVVDLAKNFGQHAALMAGFRQCAGDIIVCLDDDGQTPADEAGKLIARIEDGFDAVYASYDHKMHSFLRNAGSAINKRMAEVMIGKPKELNITSFFAIKRFVMDEMLRYENCYPYVIGLVLRSTKNICNVPVHHRERLSGHSGYSLKKLFSLWVNGFTSFSVKPLRFATYLGGVVALVGFVYLIFIFINYFSSNAAPQGWSSTMAILLFLGGMILIVLGLIGEYVGRIYMCSNAAPQYVIRMITEIEADGVASELTLHDSAGRKEDAAKR